MIKVEHYDKPAERAGAYLNQVITEFHSYPTLLLLSGGPLLLILDHISRDVLGSNLTIGVLDERCGSDSSVNNFEQLMKTSFYRRVHEQGGTSIDTSVRGGMACSDLERAWSVKLHDWFERNEEGKVIAMLGLGRDGHTAGILPGVYDVDFGSSDVVSYTVAPSINKYPERATTTFSFLRNKVDRGLMFVSGDDRKDVLKQVLHGSDTITDVPGRIIHDMKSIVVYTDIDLSDPVEEEPELELKDF